MNPVSERYLLIERLDSWVIWAIGVYCLVGFTLYFITRKYKLERVNNIQHVVDGLMMLGVVGYLYWRFFLAWKGIYYP